MLITGDYAHYDNHDFHSDFGPPDPVRVPPEMLDRVMEADLQNFGWREVYGASLNLYYDFAGGMRLASISAVRGYDVVAVQEGDGTRNFGLAGAGTFLSTARNDQSQTQFSQELRLHSPTGGALQWLAGLYYYRETLKNYQNFLAGFNLGTVIAGSSTIDDSKTDTESYAAFGSATWRFDDRFSVTASLQRSTTAGWRCARCSASTARIRRSARSSTRSPSPIRRRPSISRPSTSAPTRNAIRDKELSGDLTFTQQWTPDVSTFLKYAPWLQGAAASTPASTGASRAGS
ncbi:MAG: TonB-dependent receptor [Sphingomonas sp.]